MEVPWHRLCFGWICFLQTCCFSLHKPLFDGLESCGSLVDYCDVFISCLDSHSDGTHSLQRIHWWTSDAMLNFFKSVPMKKQTHLHLLAWGCIHFQQIWIFGWSSPLNSSSHSSSFQDYLHYILLTFALMHVSVVLLCSLVYPMARAKKHCNFKLDERLDYIIHFDSNPNIYWDITLLTASYLTTSPALPYKCSLHELVIYESTKWKEKKDDRRESGKGEEKTTQGRWGQKHKYSDGERHGWRESKRQLMREDLRESERGLV